MTDARSGQPIRKGRLGRVGYSIACLGWRGALAELAKRPDSPETDAEFDAMHGTNTAGSVEPADLGIRDADTVRKAIRYLPSPLRVTSWMLNEIGVDPARCSFVDIGCGKGRVLLVAAERPFRHIAGVEISTELADIARLNTQRYRPASSRVGAIAVSNSDARDFEMPSGDLLIHMYHPFDPAISAAVFARLATSADARPRRVSVAYLTYTHSVPAVAEMFSAIGWLRLVRYEESISGRYNWLFYDGSTPG
ncbi:MAG: class I SAM-dependent methyltransferase [Gemmatimonadaceae bacterium]|nr:class I SAM-dependent methyltransferase [Gemmatimonadaceae bacterium]